MTTQFVWGDDWSITKWTAKYKLYALHKIHWYLTVDKAKLVDNAFWQ